MVAVLGAIVAVMAVKSGESNLDRVFVWSALTAGMLRFATPLIFGAMGGILSERSGVINIGLEGMMLMGAFFGIFGADLLGSWFLGVLVGIAGGGADRPGPRVRLDPPASRPGGERDRDQLPGDRHHRLRLHLPLRRPGHALRHLARSEPELPLVDDIPFIGEAFGRMNVLTLAALILVPILTLFLFRTRGGLRLRSVGEKPRAADSLGLPVLRTRYLAVTASGALAATGGVFLSIGLLGSFNEQMTAGRGFIALAAVIFGSWRPVGALLGALLFGFSTALAQRLSGFSESTAVLFQALPYVLTLVVVAGVIGRSRPPAAIGVPYVKE